MPFNCLWKRSILLCIGLLISIALTPLSAQSLQDQARILYYQSMIEDEEVPFNEKKSHFDSIIIHYTNINQTENARLYSYEQMKAYFTEGHYLEAYKIGLGIIESFGDKHEKPSIEEEELKGKTYLLIGRCCLNLEMYDESISNFSSVIRIPENPHAIEAYSYLGFVFMQMGQMEQSRNYNDIAYNLLLETDSTSFHKAASVVYNNLGGYYYNASMLDSTLYYLNLTLDYFEYASNLFSKSFIYHNMALIYWNMEEDAMAEDFLRKAIDTSKNEPYYMARYLKSLAFILYQSGRLKEAEEYYYKAIEAAETANSKRIKSAALTELSEIFYQKQQYKKAWEYLMEGMALGDSLHNSQDMEKVSILSRQLDNYKITTEKELLEKELQVSHLANQKKSILIGIFIFLFLGVAVFTYVQIKRIRRRSAVSIEKETKSAKENIRKEYETTLDEKNRKLASNALYLMKTNEILTTIDSSIKQLSVIKDPAKRKEISREMELVINSYNAGQGWEEFKFYFEQIHPSFYLNLNKINPNLSKTEQRLCALLVLNMSVKEIAEITNRSIRTVETVIYRIRKGLNIPADEKTTQFLRQFL